MVKVFVYGTLKSGYRLNNVMSGSKVCDDVLKGFTLYTNGYYPTAVSTKDNLIKGEVWDITPESFQDIVWIEEGAGYSTEKGITVSGEEVYFFLGKEENIKGQEHIGEQFI